MLRRPITESARRSCQHTNLCRLGWRIRSTRVICGGCVRLVTPVVLWLAGLGRPLITGRGLGRRCPRREGAQQLLWHVSGFVTPGLVHRESKGVAADPRPLQLNAQRTAITLQRATSKLLQRLKSVPC